MYFYFKQLAQGPDSIMLLILTIINDHQNCHTLLPSLIKKLHWGAGGRNS